MSPYDSIQELPSDPIFGLSAKFLKDPRQNKYTFVTGYFRGDNLVTPVLDTVAEVELALAKERMKREYLPISGDKKFCDLLGHLIFGGRYDESEMAAIHTVGGTGALYLAGRLATHFTDQIAISQPTWSNHWNIFTHAGLKTEPYPYYLDRKLHFDWCLEKLNSLAERACVLLHTSCHNPTGMDLTKEQWMELSALMKKKRLFPLFDMAYLGFSGEPDDDAFAPRYFFDEGHAFALTFTAAKNFSIYSERVGALYFAGDPKKMEAVRSHVMASIRGSYSNPPVHGACIVKRILSEPELKKRWIEELKGMRKRMDGIRARFTDLLTKKDPNGGWEFIRNGKGLFFFSELTPKSIEKLRVEKGLYIAEDGRVNLTGLNDSNLELFVDAFLECHD